MASAVRDDVDVAEAHAVGCDPFADRTGDLQHADVMSVHAGDGGFFVNDMATADGHIHCVDGCGYSDALAPDLLAHLEKRLRPEAVY